MFKKNTYNISTVNSNNGTVQISKNTANYGDEITVTATAAKGYAVRTIYVDGVAISGNKFTMPAKDVTVEAVFSPVVKINTQPTNYTGIVGNTAKFTVAASGKDLTYQWQVYKNGAWKNTSLSGATTNTLSVGVVDSRNGMQFRCVVTDTYGDTVISNTVKLTVLNVAITEQPVDYTGAIGETAIFTVGAAGTGLTYQWQVYKSGAWKNTSLPGSTTNKLSVGITSSRNGMKFRCLVTSSNGKVVVSDTATLNVMTIKITTQPEDYTGAIGETAEFYVGAEGEGLTYQWQVYKNGAWKNTSLPGAATSTLSAEILESRNGMIFRCVVKDANGCKLISDEVTLGVDPITITSQPEDYEGTIGDTAEFTIEAEGEDLTYQWQVYKNGAWKNTSLPGNKTDTLEVEILASRDGMIFRCVITDENGNEAISEEVVLNVLAITIVEQPANYVGSVGETAVFFVEAEGEDLTYQWQVYKNGAWKNTSLSGNDRPSLIVDVLASRDGMQFRCVVSDSNGNEVATEAVTITVNN